MYRRRRLGAGVVVILVVVLISFALTGSGGGHARAASKHAAKHPGRTVVSTKVVPVPPPAAIEAGLMPWKLTAPVSREVVLPGAGSDVLIEGGLAADQTSDSGIYDLDTANGDLSQAGSLATAVHDGSGASVDGRDLVFGGGSPNTFATVQSSPAPSSSPASGLVGQASGSLPAPRSDSSAVTIGATAYVVGGYDGTNPTPSILATTDGTTFTAIANLPIPVRYPAVAAASGRIYVFGGQIVGGPTATDGQPTDAIQMVDPADHESSVIGHLPIPLEAAVAFNVSGQIYLTGGDSTQAPSIVAGAGTTQLDGWGSAPGSTATAGLSAVGTIWAFDPATSQVATAGQLQVPVAHAGVAVVGGRAWVIGGESGSDSLATVQVLQPNRTFGTAGAPGAGSPYFGYKLLIADRGNNRLLFMDASDQVSWTYPSAQTPADPLDFYFPDDAFFIDHGTAIISNQEQNETIIEIAFPSGKVTWTYGHPKQSGTAPGYLYEPDDAYLLRNGQISVADAQNCRVLVLNTDGTVAHQIGTDGTCVHNPPASMGEPNGDTPLWDGNLLVSEITGSWVSEYTPTGTLVWTVHLPIAYPSDPQQLDSNEFTNADHYLIADYSSPGEILEFTRAGQILKTYAPASGPGELNHPSLVEELNNGIYLVNDDYDNRMAAVDSTTGALVWQYGITGQTGTTPGLLNTPDGFDLLAPDGSTPTHPQTG